MARFNMFTDKKLDATEPVLCNEEITYLILLMRFAEKEDIENKEDEHAK